VKEEGWWLVLGDVNTHELLALKRISFADHTTARLTFPVVNGAGREMTGVTLFFMSDSYLGLDQQYFVPVVNQQSTQRRRTQAPLQQRPALDSQAAGPAANRQADDGDTAEIANGLGQMNLGSASSGGAADDATATDQSVGQEAKQQRPNARRRRN